MHTTKLIPYYNTGSNSFTFFKVEDKISAEITFKKVWRHVSHQSARVFKTRLLQCFTVPRSHSCQFNKNNKVLNVVVKPITLNEIKNYTLYISLNFHCIKIHFKQNVYILTGSIF